MKRFEVRVCACAQCVMNGAMDIVESIESLQELKNQLRFNATIKVSADEVLCEKSSGESSPLVTCNGEVFEKCTSEMITAKILKNISKKSAK